MSAKASGLCWDLPCPQMVNGIAFRPSHKFTLLAYADHADHNGKNIWPAVPTIARKTGYEDRSIQRLTNDLEAMGLLVEDGQGPRGTNKWRLPYNERGDGLSPRRPVTGDIGAKSLDDSALGDSASDDTESPEGTEPELKIDSIPEQKYWQQVLDQLEREIPRASFDGWVRDTRAIRYDGNTLTIAARSDFARDWLESRLQATAERLLIGIMNASVSVAFVNPEVP